MAMCERSSGSTVSMFRIRYDNLKTAVTKILKGRDRIENARFIALAVALRVRVVLL